MADFFSIALSQNGDKLSLLGVPPQLAHSLGDNLRSTWPHRVASDRAREDGVHIIELRKGYGTSGSYLLRWRRLGADHDAGGDSDRTTFHAFVLGYFGNIGFKLDGSIPMGKAGPLGFGSRKELWVFRGSRARPPSAHSQRSQRSQRREYRE